MLAFPFTDASSSKRRPALILLDAGDADVVLARVTNQVLRSAFDVEIVNWRSAGLLLPSLVQVHKLATLDKDLIERRLGRLTVDDWAQTQAAIKQLFKLY